MDQPQGDHETAGGTSSDTQIVAASVESSAEEQQKSDLSGSHTKAAAAKDKYSEDSLSRKVKRYFLKLRQAGPDRHIELFVALVIAVFAGVQWYTSWTNNNSTTQQTDQLITAAKISAASTNQNAAAASSFADSAHKINGGINNAVDRLNLQAQATSVLAENASAQLRTMQAQLEISQRPWLSVVPSVIGPLTFDERGHANINFSFAIRNSGHSPAINVILIPSIHVLSILDPRPNISEVEQGCIVFSKIKGMDIQAGSIFPDSERVRSVGLGIEPDEITKKIPPLGGFFLAVSGCVRYQPSYDSSKWYTTAVLYTVIRMKPGHPEGGFYFIPNEPVDASCLRLANDSYPEVAE
jgi:hypothetical protein